MISQTKTGYNDFKRHPSFSLCITFDQRHHLLFWFAHSASQTTCHSYKLPVILANYLSYPLGTGTKAFVLINLQATSLSLSLYFTVPHVTSPFEFPMKETCWKTNRIHFHFKIQKREMDGRQITSQQLRLAFKEQENSMALWFLSPTLRSSFPLSLFILFMVDCHIN